MLEFSNEFKKRYKKLPAKVKFKVNLRLNIFIANEFNETLDNHKLHGEYEGCRSINITGDFRVIYYERIKGIYKLVTVGTHSQLY
jgi:mRNA interferase YafQ